MRSRSTSQYRSRVSGSVTSRAVPPELHVAAGIHAVCGGAVHGQPWVSLQVERLLRAPHHAEHQLPVDEVELARTHARRAVGPHGAEEHQLVGSEPPLGRVADPRTSRRTRSIACAQPYAVTTTGGRARFG